MKGSPEPALAVKSVARSRHRNTRGPRCRLRFPRSRPTPSATATPTERLPPTEGGVLLPRIAAGERLGPVRIGIAFDRRTRTAVDERTGTITSKHRLFRKKPLESSVTHAVLTGKRTTGGCVKFRRSYTLTWFSVALMVAGALGTILFGGWLFSDAGRRHIVILILSPLVFLIGLIGLIATLTPLSVYVDRYGIRVRNKRTRVNLSTPVPWQAFSAVTIEPTPDAPDDGPYLVVWPRGPIPGLPDDNAIRRGDAVGIPVVLLSDLAHPTEELVDALRRFAGPLFQEDMTSAT